MKYRVMVVDDSRIVHAEIQKILQGTEFEIVSFVRSGEEALKMYETVRPDIVTMDIIMPGIDGLTAATKILKKWPDARMVMASSLAYDEIVEEAYKAGIKHFLFKPFNQEAMLKMLYSALAERTEKPE